jgi:hypothetical protein
VNYKEYVIDTKRDGLNDKDTHQYSSYRAVVVEFTTYDDQTIH